MKSSWCDYYYYNRCELVPAGSLFSAKMGGERECEGGKDDGRSKKTFIEWGARDCWWGTRWRKKKNCAVKHTPPGRREESMPLVKVNLVAVTIAMDGCEET